MRVRDLVGVDVAARNRGRGQWKLSTSSLCCYRSSNPNAGMRGGRAPSNEGCEKHIMRVQALKCLIGDRPSQARIASWTTRTQSSLKPVEIKGNMSSLGERSGKQQSSRAMVPCSSCSAVVPVSPAPPHQPKWPRAMHPGPGHGCNRTARDKGTG